MMRIIMSGLVVCGALGQAAMAEDDPFGRARSTSTAVYVPLRGLERSHAHIVTRRTVSPAATVSRELSEQSVRPHLIELRLVQTTVYIDPEVNYLEPGHSHLDDGHSIVRAQRMAADLAHGRDAARGPRVVYGRPPRETVVADEMEPAFIMMKPDYLDRKEREGQIPKVPGKPAPTQEKTQSKLMAAATPNR